MKKLLILLLIILSTAAYAEMFDVYDEKKTSEYIEKAKKTGQVKYYEVLGYLFYRGNIYIKKDLDKAIKWLTIASEKDSTKSMKYCMPLLWMKKIPNIIILNPQKSG